MVGAAEASRSGSITVPAILRICGSASYSVYLFQFVFIGVLWKILMTAGWATGMPKAAIFLMLAIAGGVGGGIAMSRSVEYPLIRLSRREAFKPLHPATLQ